jgi:glutamate formiminotransferase/formiminotetrahydrofolate cyclodeaminase
MDAFGLPKSTDSEKAIRKQAIQAATLYAIQIPYKVMELSYQSMEVMKVMAEIGNPNSVSDAGVGALAARSAVLGAFLNVKINAEGLEDKAKVNEFLQKGEQMVAQAQMLESQILGIVNKKITKS